MAFLYLLLCSFVLFSVSFSLPILPVGYQDDNDFVRVARPTFVNFCASYRGLEDFSKSILCLLCKGISCHKTTSTVPTTTTLQTTTAPTTTTTKKIVESGEQ